MQKTPLFEAKACWPIKNVHFTIKITTTKNKLTKQKTQIKAVGLKQLSPSC